MKSTKSQADKVVKPPHYCNNVVEPINLIMKNKLSFALGNAVKYISRAGKKQYDDMTVAESEITDLLKAKRYIEMQINLLEGKEEL